VEFLKKIWSHLSRPVTVLVIPQARLAPWRWRCSTSFFLFCLALWSALTLWAGYLAGSRVDYWITKADNQVMAAKMEGLLQDMAKSRDALELARSTDLQLRVLLGMQKRSDIVEADAVGGPTPADRMSLKAMLAGGAFAIRQAAWRRSIEALREESYKRLASFQEISWYISNQRSLYRATPNIWPTEGQLTSLFGYRFSPMSRADGESGEFHPGLDIANSPDTLIYATADGTVRFSGWSHGYGEMILIDHGYGLSTLYGHASKALVRNGQRVTRGQVIAYMGTTGRSTGAHLHYEVWRGGRPVNPMVFLKLRSGGEAAAPRARRR